MGIYHPLLKGKFQSSLTHIFGLRCNSNSPTETRVNGDGTPSKKGTGAANDLEEPSSIKDKIKAINAHLQSWVRENIPNLLVENL